MLFIQILLNIISCANPHNKEMSVKTKDQSESIPVKYPQYDDTIEDGLTTINVSAAMSEC